MGITVCYLPHYTYEFILSRLGFQPFAYKGLETGNRDVACHAVRQNDIKFVFKVIRIF